VPSLGPHGRLGALNLARALASDRIAVIVALRDLDLAAECADLVVLLEDGALRAFGAPEHVLASETLERVLSSPPPSGVARRGSSASLRAVTDAAVPRSRTTSAVWAARGPAPRDTGVDSSRGSASG
jgi:iron complex transport system ATP-binding protein